MVYNGIPAGIYVTPNKSRPRSPWTRHNVTIDDSVCYVYSDGDFLDDGDLVDWDSCGRSSPRTYRTNDAYVVGSGGNVDGSIYVDDWGSCGNILYPK